MLDRNKSARKLFSGVFRLSSVILFYVYLGPEWVGKFQKEIMATLSDDPDSAGAELVAALFGGVIAIWMLYWFVQGIYRIYTFNMYLDAFEAKLTPFQKRNMRDSVSSNSNIDAAIRYRDGKMRTMTPEQAARYCLDTSSLLNNTGNDSVRGYINSKMTIMTPEQRVEYLRSGKK